MGGVTESQAVHLFRNRLNPLTTVRFSGSRQPCQVRASVRTPENLVMRFGRRNPSHFHSFFQQRDASMRGQLLVKCGVIRFGGVAPCSHAEHVHTSVRNALEYFFSAQQSYFRFIYGANKSSHFAGGSVRVCAQQSISVPGSERLC